MENNELKHLEFVVYCMETFRAKKNLDAVTAYHKLKESGAIDFIDNNFAALHTFCDEHIVWNIDEFLKNDLTTINRYAIKQ